MKPVKPEKPPKPLRAAVDAPEEHSEQVSTPGDSEDVNTAANYKISDNASKNVAVKALFIFQRLILTAHNDNNYNSYIIIYFFSGRSC